MSVSDLQRLDAVSFSELQRLDAFQLLSSKIAEMRLNESREDRAIDLSATNSVSSE